MIIKPFHYRTFSQILFSTTPRLFSSSSNGIYVPPYREPIRSEIEQLEEFLYRSKRLFVLTGAGISTESGIPDYRSEGVGLYARTTNRPM